MTFVAGPDVLRFVCRGVAQPGRALGSGPRGRRFKSSRPDQKSQEKGRNSPGIAAFRVSGTLPEWPSDGWFRCRPAGLDRKSCFSLSP